jgi:FkbM family methyltransferase
MPQMLTVLPVFGGVYPFARVRFGNAKEVQIRVRNLGVISIPDKTTAMTFANIWVRHVYPVPSREDVVLDLGANIGMFTLFALRSGAKFCHSVEPCPDSVRRIREHVAGAGFKDRNNLIPSAIGDSAGTAFIPVTTNVANTISSEKNSETVPVPVLDAAVLFESLRPEPTYLKLDIESNELPVLRRLLSTPKFASVRTVAVEVKGDHDEMVNTLREAGFSVSVKTYPETIVMGLRSANVPKPPVDRKVSADAVLEKSK